MKLPVSLSFYSFDIGNLDDVLSLGGTGIEVNSLVNFLNKQLNLRVQLIRFPKKRRTIKNKFFLFKIGSILLQKLSDLLDLLSANGKIVLFLYPKIPLLDGLAHPRIVPYIFFSYGLLFLKKQLRRQKWVVLITDLPVEHYELFQSDSSIADLYDQLKRFEDLSWMSPYHRALTNFERLFLRLADVVVSPCKIMKEHIVQKHHLPPSTIILRGRNLYLPTYTPKPGEILLDAKTGLRIFYSGDLIRDTTIASLKCILQVFTDFPQSDFYICGSGGEWIQEEVNLNDLVNVHYLGTLDYASFDAVASQCDVGLIPYNFSYAHMALTSKYSAYVANGLAVLSTNMATLTEVIHVDGVGVTVPPDDLPVQLAKWLKDPNLIAPYKERAKLLSSNFRQGSFMQDWFDSIIKS